MFAHYQTTIVGFALAFSIIMLAYLESSFWLYFALLATSSLSLMAIKSLSLLSTGLILGALLGLLSLKIAAFRYIILIKPILQWFKKTLPPMSQTEREAIEAGDVWWDAELFQGRPNWQTLHDFPKPGLTAAEQSFIDKQVETLCQNVNEWTATHDALDIPKSAWDYLKREKFFGLLIPTEYGGLGFSNLASSSIVQKIATHSLTTAVTTMVPNSLGPAELLLAYGTEAQKNHYLPKLAIGEEIPCFALTGTEAGSDAGAIPDKGIVCRGMFDGKETLGISLTWDKRYITLAPIATVVGLAFKLFDPDQILGDKKNLGITLCLIPSKHPGVKIGQRHFPLNQPFMNGPTSGKDVFIPMEWVIGGPAQIGQGWRMLVECLSAGRGISLPALSTGVGKLCYRTTGAYSRIRKQFNLAIGHFEGVGAAMARIAGLTYILEACRLVTAKSVDEGYKPSVVTAIAKYHMTEMARQIINDAMDIHGGRGIMMGPANYLARTYQGLPISITVEGANILTRNLMIFGQGVIRCHPFVRQEIKAAENKNVAEGLRDFDVAFFSHVKFSLANAVRLLCHSPFKGRLLAVNVDSPFEAYYRSMQFFSLALSVSSDMASLVLGGQLKRKERLSARLGDVLSYLYIGSTVLKFYHDSPSPEGINHVHWALQYCLYQTQTALQEFYRNFPNRIVANILQNLVFPFGSIHRAPSDNLELKLSQAMMTAGDFRDAMTKDCYIGSEAHEPVFKIEQAFKQLLAVESINAKLDQGLKLKNATKDKTLAAKIEFGLIENLITDDEANALKHYDKLRIEAIRVDAFDSLTPKGKSDDH